MEDHVRDTDCTFGPRGVCAECGAVAGPPCPECGGRAFHVEDCTEDDLEICDRCGSFHDGRGSVCDRCQSERAAERRGYAQDEYREFEPLGLTLSRLDPRGAYSPDGELIGRERCGCEDYPCCGC